MNANVKEGERHQLTPEMINRIIDASVRRILPDPRDFYTIRKDGDKTIYTVHSHVGDKTHIWQGRGIGANDERDAESSVVCAMILGYGRMPLNYASAPATGVWKDVMRNPESAETKAIEAKPVTAKPAASLETTVGVTNWDFVTIPPPYHILPNLGHDRRL